MHQFTSRKSGTVLAVLVVLGLASGAEHTDTLSLWFECASNPGPASPPKRSVLPAFSEEREAAALHFAKRHAPDLIPLLEKLKTSDGKRYEQEIREIFQVSELIADLCEENKARCTLELDLWKTEAKSLIIVAKLAGLNEEEQAKAKEDLHELAKKTTDLEMQILKLRVEELEKDLSEAKAELHSQEERRDAASKERYQRLLELAQRRGMK